VGHGTTCLFCAGFPGGFFTGSAAYVGRDEQDMRLFRQAKADNSRPHKAATVQHGECATSGLLPAYANVLAHRMLLGYFA
jgi:hypothetical protein